jgi:hypothetical protein
MTLRCPCGGALVAMVLLAVVSCSDSRRAEELELQRRQVEIMERAHALEEERLRAEQERQRAEQERQRAEQERQRREQLVSVYSSAAGRQVMEAIGGGRDLIVRYGDWTFDDRTGRFTVQMNVSFNGAIIRGNNYYVTGVLTVNEDGSAPQFARASANQNYRDAEARMTALAFTAGGLMLLSDMRRDTAR